jgi:predicted acylesterase/phospholipase RssA
MDSVFRTLGLRRSQPRPRCALALAGGGVIGGMYEVGALAAIEERLDGRAPGFEVYVGCSAGSVVASLVASGVGMRALYRILDEDIEDPLNFRRGAVYPSDAFRNACMSFGRLVWAVGKNAITGIRGSVPDMLARAERDMPAGFFKVAALERFMREAFRARGLANGFAGLPHALLIPAVDLDRAERVVFGAGDLRDVAISEAVAASCAIPGFFEPYTVAGRDYVDGGVGFTGHADLAAQAGADVVVVVNPLVPTLQDDGATMRARGVYTIMEQASRIYSQNLLQLGLSVLAVEHPRTEFFLIQPPRTCALLFGPSMGFEASRQALRYGYASTMAWLDGPGAVLLDRLARPRVPARTGHVRPAHVAAPSGQVVAAAAVAASLIDASDDALPAAPPIPAVPRLGTQRGLVRSVACGARRLGSGVRAVLDQLALARRVPVVGLPPSD